MENIYKPKCDVCGYVGLGVYYQFSPQSVITCQECKPISQDTFTKVIVTELLTSDQVKELYGEDVIMRGDKT